MSEHSENVVRPTDELVPSDDHLRQYWRNNGGEFHGPNVETGSMPETKLLPLLRRLLDMGTPAPEATSNSVTHYAASEKAERQQDVMCGYVSPDDKITRDPEACTCQECLDWMKAP